MDGLDDCAILFSESHGRAILATSNPTLVIEQLHDLPHQMIGRVGDGCSDHLRIKTGYGRIDLSLNEIEDARTSITRMLC